VAGAVVEEEDLTVVEEEDLTVVEEEDLTLSAAACPCPTPCRFLT
jgi:hypothetical protein